MRNSEPLLSNTRAYAIAVLCAMLSLLTPMSGWSTAAHDRVKMDAGETSSGERVFHFSSGGEHHPEGIGTWEVVLSESGSLNIAHTVHGKTRRYGSFFLSEDENRTLWQRIEAVNFAHLRSSTRPGLPDEVQYIFYLDDARPHVLQIWTGDMAEKHELNELVQAIASLVKRYVGQNPILE
jgi:hypothetical protein